MRISHSVLSIVLGLAMAVLVDAQDDIEPTPPAVAVGDEAPDFELESLEDQKTVKLSDRFDDDGHPVVLLFSRANW